ncbi:MAG: hypothetical protein ACR2L3_02605 [Actinomycetota bacterium]
MFARRYAVTVAASLLAALVAIAVPAGAFTFDNQVAPRKQESPPIEAAPSGPVLGPYEHLGTWVDMFNPEVWDHPERAVARMAERGVSTLYLETSNWDKQNAIYRPTSMKRFIVAAHGAGIEVVAWYVPSFANLKKDFNRSMKAIRFQTDDGQRFDSFALDIEATNVADISRRNARMERLSRMIRDQVGPDYLMGGITPDVQSVYWPSFPYATVARYFDVLMPMGYFTYRVSGMRAAERYTKANVREVRERAGDPALPVHPIGGIAGDATVREVRGYVNGVQETRAIGGSFYDFPITDGRTWNELAPLADTGPL